MWRRKTEPLLRLGIAPHVLRLGITPHVLRLGINLQFLFCFLFNESGMP